MTSGPGRGRQPARDRPPRLRPLAAVLLEDVAAVDAGTPDSVLLDWLEAALAQLPSAERAAVMTTYGYAEGSEAVGADLGLTDQDAEALSRNALQLLRARLAEAEPDERTRYPKLPVRNRRKSTRAPD